MKICTDCGARLDAGERCDCQRQTPSATHKEGLVMRPNNNVGYEAHGRGLLDPDRRYGNRPLGICDYCNGAVREGEGMEADDGTLYHRDCADFCDAAGDPV